MGVKRSITMPRPARKSVRNADGSLKTIDQLMRQTLTVLQYGRMLAAKGK